MLSFDIERIVPRFIRNDRNGFALMKAIEAALKYFCSVCDSGVANYNDVDRMDEWRLNEMAWELGAEWYDSTTDVDMKRSQVRAINTVFRTLGTLRGVKMAAEGVFGDCEVIEYLGGYYPVIVPKSKSLSEMSAEDDDVVDFAYSVRVSDPMATGSKLAEFMRIIGIVQPVRCNLISVSYNGEQTRTALNAMTKVVGAISTASGTAR